MKEVEQGQGQDYNSQGVSAGKIVENATVAVEESMKEESKEEESLEEDE